MFAPFAEVPGYPLVFIVFWGAAAFFCLAMARHLRVFAVARPSRPFAQLPVRVVSLVEYAFLQTKMFKDPGAATMHAGIFWGFVLLTIGTANIVTGGVIQGVLSIPFDGLLWTLVSAMQNVVAVAVLGSIGWAFYRRLISKPRRLTFNRDALDHPVDDRRRGRDRTVRPGLRCRGARRHPGRLRLERARAATDEPLGTGPRCRLRHPVVGPHRARRGVPVLPAVQQASPHRDRVPEHLLPEAGPARRAAQARPRGRERDVRPQDTAGPRLEGPARRLHLHRMRALPGGLSGLQHGQAAQPQGTDHGHPPHVGGGGARHRHHPELADRARHLRSRRHDRLADDAGQADRR